MIVCTFLTKRERLEKKLEPAIVSNQIFGFLFGNKRNLNKKCSQEEAKTLSFACPPDSFFTFSLS
jgi:hypothetical protein